jgi:hypothetical protein
LLAAAALALAALVWVEGRGRAGDARLAVARPRAGRLNLVMIAMGLAMMAPSIYLPTLLQSVQGLGAIAAGLVLASLSLGWPVASALSARLYLRIGYRDTALLGAALALAAALGFAPSAAAAGVGRGAGPAGAGRGLRPAVHRAAGGRAVGGGLAAARRGHRRQHVCALPGAKPGGGGVRRRVHHAVGQRLAQAPQALRGQGLAGVDSVLALLQAAPRRRRCGTG